MSRAWTRPTLPRGRDNVHVRIASWAGWSGWASCWSCDQAWARLPATPSPADNSPAMFAMPRPGTLTYARVGWLVAELSPGHPTMWRLPCPDCDGAPFEGPLQHRWPGPTGPPQLATGADSDCRYRQRRLKGTDALNINRAKRTTRRARTTPPSGLFGRGFQGCSTTSGAG